MNPKPDAANQHPINKQSIRIQISKITILCQQKRRNVHQPSFFHLSEVQTTNGDASRLNNVEIWA